MVACGRGVTYILTQAGETFWIDLHKKLLASHGPQETLGVKSLVWS